MRAAWRTSGSARRQPQETRGRPRACCRASGPRVPRFADGGPVGEPPRIWGICGAKRARRAGGRSGPAVAWPPPTAARAARRAETARLARPSDRPWRRAPIRHAPPRRRRHARRLAHVGGGTPGRNGKTGSAWRRSTRSRAIVRGAAWRPSPQSSMFAKWGAAPPCGLDALGGDGGRGRRAAL